MKHTDKLQKKSSVRVAKTHVLINAATCWHWFKSTRHWDLFTLQIGENQWHRCTIHDLETDWILLLFPNIHHYTRWKPWLTSDRKTSESWTLVWDSPLGWSLWGQWAAAFASQTALYSSPWCRLWWCHRQCRPVIFLQPGGNNTSLRSLWVLSDSDHTHAPKH